MKLGEILNEEQIIAELKATNRWEAIDELINHLVAIERIKTDYFDTILDAVRKRESSMSTGIGFGIAIPHATTDLVHEVIGGFGRSSKRIDFEALDGEPVSLVILLIVPQGRFQKHLRTLADIARLLHEADLRRMLQEAPDAKSILELIRSHSKTGSAPALNTKIL